MNIILQNYKNIIEKIIKDTISSNIEDVLKKFEYNNINNYINILSSFDKSLCECFKQSFIHLINELDNNYKHSKERKAKYHIKDTCNRTILTIFGEITIRRTLSYCFIFIFKSHI